MSNFQYEKLFRELAEPSSSSSLQAASGRYVGRGGVHHHQRGFEAFTDHV
ncbi:MAG: hypothetical protein P8J52_08755 [Gammaproteobacteria bacterium]|nr:hypothetical protein [Gammaproteobacteria bacterium]